MAYNLILHLAAQNSMIFKLNLSIKFGLNDYHNFLQIFELNFTQLHFQEFVRKKLFSLGFQFEFLVLVYLELIRQ